MEPDLENQKLYQYFCLLIFLENFVKLDDRLLSAIKYKEAKRLKWSKKKIEIIGRNRLWELNIDNLKYQSDWNTVIDPSIALWTAGSIRVFWKIERNWERFSGFNSTILTSSEGIVWISCSSSLGSPMKFNSKAVRF